MFLKVSVLFFVLVGLFACSGNKNTSPMLIQSPSWIREYDNKHEFSALGITTGNGKLVDRVRAAERNGLQNLHLNIGVELENLLLEEARCMDDNRKSMLVDAIMSDVSRSVSAKKLASVARRDSLWDSPNGNGLYVLMVADKKLVLSVIVESLNSVQKKYQAFSDACQVIVNTKYDISTNNFVARKRACPKKDTLIIEKNKTTNAGSPTDNSDVSISNVVISRGEKSDGLQQQDKEQKLVNDADYSNEEITKIVEEAIRLAEQRADRTSEKTENSKEK